MSMRSPACRSAMVSTPVPWRMRNVSFVGAADQQILARAAEQQVPAAPADEVILARLSDESVVAAPAEQVIVALAAENQIVAPPAEGKVVSAASENGVVPNLRNISLWSVPLSVSSLLVPNLNRDLLAI